MLFGVKLLSKGRFYLQQNFSSALFITGDKAQKTCPVVIPVIDAESQLDKKDALLNNINARNLSVDINKLETKWKFFQYVDGKIKGTETKRIELGNLISALSKKADSEEEVKRLKIYAKLLKDDLKVFKDFFYQLEENTMLEILKLPNTLHEKTLLANTVIYNSSEKLNAENTKCHMNELKENGYLEYINSLNYYFKSEAALFERSVLNYSRHCLIKNGYMQFSNSGFCRTAIIEACGEGDEMVTEHFLLEESDSSLNQLYLCGDSTLYSFMAYFTRHSVYETYFPLKLFTIGKYYRPHHNKMSNDLFGLCQESALNVFIAMAEHEDLLDEIIKEVTIFFESLGYHFRLSILPSNELKISESLRLSIQMYSNFLKSYVEVGNISTYGSYLSKRLLFNYTKDGEKRYPNVISGQLLMMPKLLACVLENNSIKGSNLMTDLLNKYKFV